MTSTPEPVRLDERGILRVAEGVAQKLDLAAGGARIIKFTNNAVVRLPEAGAVVRIAGSAAVQRRLNVVLTAARLYAAHGIPAVQLHPAAPGPVQALGHTASVWLDSLKPHARPPEPADLAAILHAIHVIDGTPAEVPAWNMINGIRRRIAAADGASDQDLTFLTGECNELEIAVKELDSIPPLLPPGLIHGDAFLGNVIPADPNPVICDFDSTAIGPREWDLTPIAVGALRMNYPDGLQREFAEAYGVDVTTWDGFPILRRLRELQLVTSVLPALRANPRLRPPWQHRLHTLEAADTGARWEPYPYA